MITDHQHEQENLVEKTKISSEHPHHDCESVIEGVKSRPFWLILAMTITGGCIISKTI